MTAPRVWMDDNAHTLDPVAGGEVWVEQDGDHFDIGVNTKEPTPWWAQTEQHASLPLTRDELIAFRDEINKALEPKK